MPDMPSLSDEDVDPFDIVIYCNDIDGDRR